jgi:Phytoene dehydrogenase and related proteins
MSRFEQHAKEIYNDPQWPTNPLFYVSVNSVTDDTVAPAGCDNMVLLIPCFVRFRNDDEATREKYFQQIIKRMEKHTGNLFLTQLFIKKHFLFLILQVSIIRFGGMHMAWQTR